MQVNNTNNQQISPNMGCQACTQTATVPQGQPIQKPCCAVPPSNASGLQNFKNQTNPQQSSPCYQPQQPYMYSMPMQYYGVQPQSNAQGTSPAVNIQIINPSVATPGASPTYNVNAPSYPANYYTQDMSGKSGQNNPNQNGIGANDKGSVGDAQNNQGQSNNSVNNSTNNSTDVNNKKKETRTIVQIDDDYIKTLENYLNSKDKNLRLMGAKKVYDRLEEDSSRHDDKALTALINKMLQDPSPEIRLIAMTAVESGMVDGNDYTANVLRKMQSSKDVYGQDSVDASKALLNMSEKKVKKEFDVENDKNKKSTTKTTTTTTKTNEKKE